MVTTARSRDYTAPALRSFWRTTNVASDDRFLLFDNDASYELERSCRPEEVHLVKHSEPHSFAANVNLALREAHASNSDCVFLNNDIILAPDWLEAIAVPEPIITAPLCNREVQYRLHVTVAQSGELIDSFACGMPMELADYDGHEAAFEAIARAHQNATQSYLPVAALPFFCIRIPWEVIDGLGALDESFGKGGGEDYDYCLRARLAGFEVRYATRSYLLHFGGKSTWSGAEDAATRLARERQFTLRFEEKWGSELTDLVLKDNQELLRQRPELQEKIRTGGISAVLAELLRDRSYEIKLPLS